jgi:hypothetical protein
VSAGAVAPDGDARPVDTQGIGLSVSVLERGQRVVEGGREGMFRGQTVLDRHDLHLRVVREEGHKGVVGGSAADDPPSAVEEHQQGGRRTEVARRVERRVKVATGGVDGEVFADDVFEAGPLQRVSAALEGCAGLPRRIVDDE